EAAIESFKQAIVLDPSYAQAWAGLGDGYAQRFGRFGYAITWLDSAIGASERAIELDSNSAEGHTALGTALAYKGFIEEAIPEFEMATELNPSYFLALGTLVNLHVNRGALDEALLWAKKVTILNPGFPVNYALMGEIYRQFGDFTRAEEFLMKALQLQPDLLDAHQFLSLLHLVQNKKEQAIEEIKKAVASTADDPRNLDRAARVMSIAGNISLAREYYERAIK
ncbi:MAG: tetratricopeptide repeat protein, partial [Bacteroidota bacterium]